MLDLESKLIRKGLELGFTNVGFTELRDYPEYLEDVRSRPDYAVFSENDDSLLTRLSMAKTLNPWAKSIVCATLGFSDIDYPHDLVSSVARIYLARTYSPEPGTVHAFQLSAFADYIESCGLKVERNQFCVPQRIACAEAGVVTLGNNNFAYTEQDGSFIVLVTFLVDAELQPTGSRIANDCPPDCDLCIKACPTKAIKAPRRLDLERCILFNNQRFKPGAQEEIWEQMGIRIHGCDVCQMVCPKNHDVLHKAKEKDPFLELLSEEFDLERILLLDDEYYELVVRPIMYNYIKDLDIFRRNAAVALGNTGDPSHLSALQKAREVNDNEEVLKAIDWAINKLSS